MFVRIFPYTMGEADDVHRYLTGVATFAMGLRISLHEHELRSQLCRPAWVALGLTNDLYSIDKERAAAKLMGEEHVCNAVWVAQQEYGLDEDAAKELCPPKDEGECRPVFADY